MEHLECEPEEAGKPKDFLWNLGQGVDVDVRGRGEGRKGLGSVIGDYMDDRSRLGCQRLRVILHSRRSAEVP